MSNNNNERDQQARRVLREARRLLEQQPEPYTPPASFRERMNRRVRMIDEDVEELGPFEPAPARLDTRQQPQPEPDWAPWETWLESRLNAAVAIEREKIYEVLAEVVAGERDRAAEAWRDQVRGLRADLDKTAQLLDQLGKVIEYERSERAKVVVDLPALPRSGMN